ncbi:MAG: glycosyltransferase [Myxococcales bacterium]|nr:glycosyltransferase [Myxococcales bacterium]
MARIVLALTDPRSALLVRGQLAYLRQRGFDVHLVTGAGEPAGALAAAEGATHHTIAIERDLAPGGDLRAVAAMTRLLARLRPTLVDGSTPKAGLVAMVAATAAWCRCGSTLRGLRLETTRGLRRAALWTGHRVTCQLADRVICVSPSLRTRAIELGVVPVARAVVLGPGSGNGVDPDVFDPARHAAAGATLRAELGVAPTASVVAFVGRLSRDKGVGELAAAWAGRATRGAHLLVVGLTTPPIRSPPPRGRSSPATRRSTCSAIDARWGRSTPPPTCSCCRRTARASPTSCSRPRPWASPRSPRASPAASTSSPTT